MRSPDLDQVEIDFLTELSCEDPGDETAAELDDVEADECDQ